ncbi:MAG TPA: DUF222 domain-containing protein [Acidimicrobiales bacterium]|nr:DUF222 domain-containing protein [Acidimicrobiales bacterium]
MNAVVGGADTDHSSLDGHGFRPEPPGAHDGRRRGDVERAAGGPSGPAVPASVSGGRADRRPVRRGRAPPGLPRRWRDLGRELGRREVQRGPSDGEVSRAHRREGLGPAAIDRSTEEGEITLDKLRAVADVATPETDAELVEAARERSVRELAEVARSHREAPAPSQAAQDHDRRSLRFNDTFRTMTVHLPPESFAETRSCIESIARDIPSDGETPWDQRMCDGFMGLIRSQSKGGDGGDAATKSPYFVVVHVPIAALVEESGETSDLAGELERDGLLSVATVQQLACDATVALAVDDHAGRTMYEGRSRRDPSGPQRREVRRRDRHCRFPGCVNVTFTNTHHIKRWKPDRGPTDLDNLCLLCVHHHHLVHRGDWTCPVTRTTNSPSSGQVDAS